MIQKIFITKLLNSNLQSKTDVTFKYSKPSTNNHKKIHSKILLNYSQLYDKVSLKSNIDRIL